MHCYQQKMKSFRQFLFCTFQFDPYFILGVKKSASLEEIRSAYLNLSKKYHPDVNSSPDASEKFKAIHEAYNILKKAKFEAQVREEFKQQFYAAQSEEELFKQVFGFYFYENPTEYYKPENAGRRQEYQDLLRKHKKNKEKTQEGIDLKVNRVYKDNNNYSKTNHSNLFKAITLLGLSFGAYGLYLSTAHNKPPETQKQFINPGQMDRIRNLAMARHEQMVENVKNMYSNINYRMLRFSPEKPAIDLLVNYTIYEDLEFYSVKPDIFYEPERKYLRSSDFEKVPLAKNKINYRISQAIEAERCLQNVFVPVEEVLNQIEYKGFYEPPGIFMQYFGYIYFRIRKKPIQIESLIQAQKYISLFDLFFHYQSPIPYYYNELDEFQLFTEQPSSQFSSQHHWEGNAFFNHRSIPKFYLKGDVRNIFIQKPKQGDKSEPQYLFAWGDHYHHYS